jgi:uncharacterized protein YndB with AHSA1/START domain
MAINNLSAHFLMAPKVGILFFPGPTVRGLARPRCGSSDSFTAQPFLMADVLHDFFIKAGTEKVFAAISESAQIDNWWSLHCAGQPTMGGEYHLFFGEPWDWRARVTRFEPGSAFEWHMTEAMDDWIGTRVGFDLSATEGGTKVRFYHRGWAEESEHFRISSYCWAQLLHLLKRWVEAGEVMPHAERLEL